jgi:quercetin dioxygenase-like cupin family protein
MRPGGFRSVQRGDEMRIRLASGRGGFVAGLAAGIAMSIVGAIAWSQTAGAGTAGKATYAIVLENERVRVRDVTFPPGVLDTGMHTHTYAHVGVILTKGALLFTDPAGKTERVAFKSGSVGFREANATHQVANPGTTPMRVIEVELKN